MSADTRRPERDQLKDWLARLAALFSTAVTLIQKRARSERMVEILLHAFQLFKEDRLLEAVAKELHQTFLTPDKLQRALSLRIDDVTGFPADLRQYLAKRGVRYVGEIYKLYWDKRGKGTLDTRKQVMDFLTIELLLPESVNVDHEWRPPYWDNPHFLAALNRPVGEVVNNNDYHRYSGGWGSDPEGHAAFLSTRMRYLHYKGVHCGGQYLHYPKSKDKYWGVGQLKDVQHTLESNCGLWAAALIPPDWKPSAGVPEEWTVQLGVIAGERELVRKNLAELHERHKSDGVFSERCRQCRNDRRSQQQQAAEVEVTEANEPSA